MKYILGMMLAVGVVTVFAAVGLPAVYGFGGGLIAAMMLVVKMK